MVWTASAFGETGTSTYEMLLEGVRLLPNNCAHVGVSPNGSHETETDRSSSSSS